MASIFAYKDVELRLGGRVGKGSQTCVHVLWVSKTDDQNGHAERSWFRHAGLLNIHVHQQVCGKGLCWRIGASSDGPLRAQGVPYDDTTLEIIKRCTSLFNLEYTASFVGGLSHVSASFWLHIAFWCCVQAKDRSSGAFVIVQLLSRHSAVSSYI